MIFIPTSLSCIRFRIVNTVGSIIVAFFFFLLIMRFIAANMSNIAALETPAAIPPIAPGDRWEEFDALLVIGMLVGEALAVKMLVINMVVVGTLVVGILIFPELTPLIAVMLISIAVPQQNVLLFPQQYLLFVPGHRVTSVLCHASCHSVSTSSSGRTREWKGTLTMEHTLN